MAWTRLRLSSRAIYILLLVLSAGGLWMPREWSDSLKHPMQVIVPGDDLSFAISHRAVESTSRLQDTAREERLSRDAVMHELASQIAVAEELRQENARLRGLREKYIPPAVAVLPAKVVAWDIVSWRDSLLLARGSSRGVGWQDWVASRLFVDEGGESGVEQGQAVLARECLLGRVEQVSPYMARVQLFSDVDSPRIQVQIGAVMGNKVEFVDYPCSLRGMGRNRMAIEDVPYQYIQTDETGESPAGTGRKIRVGDLICSAPGQLGLPTPLVIGRISRLEQNPKKRLVYTVAVEPAATIADIREVFVIPIIPTSPTSARK
ncbi:MAG TPA: rod shape-determining protein MreC [Phycisphaerae bacterium]|nr:rod shape-determining protein MreC [Phycisphaerae bacterium]